VVGTWKSDSGAVLELRSNGKFEVGPSKYPVTGTYTYSPGVLKLQLDGDATKAFGAAEWQVVMGTNQMTVTDTSGPTPRVMVYKRVR
jgi:hypothetical protein